ncbi:MULTISPECIES: hypothetical protein [Streptomyces]|uniref:hypothetical protein n=1 Tax=Streptomyces TaxID=1883 RepID=UPI0022700C1A|nr:MULTISPECIES: hypothetical protein [unclassified Streptomyces]MCY0923713.1 hypothetical protein [Streptomyces sp. H27-G5]MCZ4088490.1 hypothetical protein [Streptomyces sp. H34-S5]
MWNLGKRKKAARKGAVHFARRVIFATDAAINSVGICGEISTLDVQERARELFNIELTVDDANWALVTRLNQRGYVVTPDTVRSMDA